MAVNKKTPKRKKLTSLSQGRPPTLRKPPPSLSSRATRTLIRSHHTLQKQLANAVRNGDAAQAQQLQASLDQAGGLKSYQDASITGQSRERGGDSSKILMEWLKPTRSADLSRKTKPATGAKLRVLEVGALSCDNACARSKRFDVTRIDLNSQDPDILQQDFMERSLPESDADRFDLVSLSLVVNFVPDAVGRGEMLRRTAQFLSRSASATGGAADDGDDDDVFPALFLVLPLSCITNARYMNDARLAEIMQSLGYSRLKRKLSSKLAYYLWRYDAEAARKATFKKTEVNPGRTRNNFAIIMN